MAKHIEYGLLSTWSTALASAGIVGVDVVSDVTENAHDTGSGDASFRWGNLMVRLVRDRGQDFVDVGSAAAPENYFSLDDVGVAEGWRSITSVLARQGPAVLVDELREIVAHRTELESALAPQRLASTCAAVTAARKRREQAFLEKLKKLAEGTR
jgi:hypothetical protein